MASYVINFLGAVLSVGLSMAALGAPGVTNAPLVTIPPVDEILKPLRKEHPRLLATAKDFSNLKAQVRTDAQLQAWHQALHEQGEKMMLAKPSEYEIPDGLRLLSVSRRVLNRVQTLGLLFHLEGDKRYLDRTWRELEAAAAFKDWNPRHFLDTAEMTHAFALGYDWLYHAWTPGQRATLKQALVDKGLRLGVECYRGTARYGGWMKARHNWNQVCNGGIGMGALAVAEDEPNLAAEFLHQALNSLQLPMAEFAPDGAWNEGPGYWNYATTYNFVILAALHTALGTDFGLSNIPGMAESGMFPIYATGPLQRTFNYADASDSTIRAPHLFWMSRHFDRPVYAAYQRPLAYPQALDLLWFDPRGRPELIRELPLDKYFRNAEVATFRSGWDDREALFAGVKAGDNKANHSNLDLGTFVLDALGYRWAVDLGADNYNLPGYFGGQRWNYYRLRAEGHNTLVINPGLGPDQDPKAAARITRFNSEPRQSFAIMDLTPAYAAQARSVQRGFSVFERKQVLVQDEVQSDQPVEVWWFFHTPAEIKADQDGKSAMLTQGAARLWARILSPSAATFETMEARPLPDSPRPENQAVNERTRKLAVHVKATKDLRLAVLLVPLAGGAAPPARMPEVFPLERW